MIYVLLLKNRNIKESVAFKGRKSHIFETELCGDKTWIIANEVDGRGVALHSISDNEKVLVDIEKPT